MKINNRYNKDVQELIVDSYNRLYVVLGDNGTKVKSEINMLTDICSILIWGIVSDYQLLPNSFNKEIDNFREAYRELDFKFK